ncbi:MAG: hypothetical protein AAFY88_26860, partial [Acidobacteriota bacterium]
MNTLLFPAAKRCAISTLILTFCTLAAAGAGAAEIPLATSIAAETVDPFGVPLAALEDGSTASVWLADGAMARLKMQWLDPAGQPLFDLDGREIAGAAGAITEASILSRPGGGAYVAYGQRTDSGDVHLYAQAFGAGGESLWPGDGVRVSNIDDSQSEVSLVPDFAGGVYACFSLLRREALQCQHLDRDGDRLWTEAGLDAG